MDMDEIYDNHALNIVSDEESELDHIDFVLVYNESRNNSDENFFNRENYLKNLCMNGLKLKLIKEEVKSSKEINNDENEILVYVLIMTPVELFLQMAEKMKLKLPIAYNDYSRTHGRIFNMSRRLGTFLESVRLFRWIRPRVIDDSKHTEENMSYLNVTYDSNLHEKLVNFF